MTEKKLGIIVLSFLSKNKVVILPPGFESISQIIYGQLEIKIKNLNYLNVLHKDRDVRVRLHFYGEEGASHILVPQNSNQDLLRYFQTSFKYLIGCSIWKFKNYLSDMNILKLSIVDHKNMILGFVDVVFDYFLEQNITEKNTSIFKDLKGNFSINSPKNPNQKIGSIELEIINIFDTQISKYVKRAEKKFSQGLLIEQVEDYVMKKILQNQESDFSINHQFQQYPKQTQKISILPLIKEEEGSSRIPTSLIENTETYNPFKYSQSEFSKLEQNIQTQIKQNEDQYKNLKKNLKIDQENMKILDQKNLAIIQNQQKMIQEAKIKLEQQMKQEQEQEKIKMLIEQNKSVQQNSQDQQHKQSQQNKQTQQQIQQKKPLQQSKPGQQNKQNVNIQQSLRNKSENKQDGKSQIGLTNKQQSQISQIKQKQSQSNERKPNIISSDKDKKNKLVQNVNKSYNNVSVVQQQDQSVSKDISNQNDQGFILSSENSLLAQRFRETSNQQLKRMDEVEQSSKQMVQKLDKLLFIGEQLYHQYQESTQQQKQLDQQKIRDDRTKIEMEQKKLQLQTQKVQLLEQEMKERKEIQEKEKLKTQTNDNNFVQDHFKKTSQQPSQTQKQVRKVPINNQIFDKNTLNIKIFDFNCTDENFCSNIADKNIFVETIIPKKLINNDTNDLKAVCKNTFESKFVFNTDINKQINIQPNYMDEFLNSDIEFQIKAFSIPKNTTEIGKVQLCFNKNQYLDSC